MDRKTARKYIHQGHGPNESWRERDWRTREDLFEAVWPEVEAWLAAYPTMQAKGPEGLD